MHWEATHNDDAVLPPLPLPLLPPAVLRGDHSRRSIPSVRARPLELAATPVRTAQLHQSEVQ